MKKINLVYIFTISFIFLFVSSGCGKKESEMKDEKQKTGTTHEENSTTKESANLVKDGSYFCPMHPLLQTNEPAKCPECKMDLITKKEHNEKMMKKHEELETKYAGQQDAIHFEIKTSILKSWECEKAIKKALKIAPGVMDFSLDLLESKIHMYIDKSKTTKKDVEKVISDLGYDANETKANPDAAARLSNECK
jgi:Cu(I)/Ag(I) efflux system membrane fusion protein